MLTLLFVMSTPSPSYTPTPYGPMLTHCVREVPSGAQLTELKDGSTHVVALDGTSFHLPSAWLLEKDQSHACAQDWLGPSS